MNISEFSTKLRELSEDYSSQRIFFDEYRAKRKTLLDEIDYSVNGQNIGVSEESEIFNQTDANNDTENEHINDIFDNSENTYTKNDDNL